MHEDGISIQSEYDSFMSALRKDEIKFLYQYILSKIYSFPNNFISPNSFIHISPDTSGIRLL